MDNEDDIYGDLPNFNTSDYIVKLETKVEVLESKVKQLETSLDGCERDKRDIQINSEREKKCLSISNENLLVNVSTLFKTAKSEIERKDNIIKELRQQLDDLIFRRYQKSWPRNDIVQSQNEDDAICIKPATEERSSISSVIRSNTKNYDYLDRNKSSSEDKSPLRTRITIRTHESPDKSKSTDSSRVKYVESPGLERKSKDFNNYKYHNASAVPITNRDDYYPSKHFSDQYHNRKIERRSREDDGLKKDIDDRERKAHVDSKSKDRQRFSPYEAHRDEPARIRHRHHKERRIANNIKSGSKRSSYDQILNNYEENDNHRTFKDNYRRQDVEFSGRKSHEDRKRDEYVHPNRIECDERQKDSDIYSKKSNEDRKWDESVYSSRKYVLVSDDRRQNTEYVDRKSIESRRREEINYNIQNPMDVESVSRKLVETVRRKEPNPNCRNIFNSRRGNSEINIQKSPGDRRKDELNYRNLNAVDDHRLNAENLTQKLTTERRKVENVRTVFQISRENRRQSSRASSDEHRREVLFHSSQINSDERIRNDKNNASQSSADEDRHVFNKSINQDRRSEDLNRSRRSIDESGKDDELDNFIKNLNQKSKEELEELNYAKYEKRKMDKLVNSKRQTSPNSNHSSVSHSESRSRRKTKHLHDSHSVSAYNSDSVEPAIVDASKYPAPPLPVEAESHTKNVEVPPVLSDPSTNIDTGYAPAKEQIRRRHKHSNSVKSVHRKKTKINDPSTSCDLKIEESSLQTERPPSPREEIRCKKAKLSKSSSPVMVPCTKSVDLVAPQSSQLTVESHELPTRSVAKLVQNSPPTEERLNPLDSHMMVLEILAQYGGYYATPLKLLNGDKCSFANFKLVSPIADTPDHVKAMLNDTKIKVSPIPMINERRMLDEFNSPKKKPSLSVEQPPTKEDDKPAPAQNSINSCENLEKPVTNNESITSEPSTSASVRLNTVTSSPFKNCCIVKVKEDPVPNTNAEGEVPEVASANTGTDTTNAEHGVFTRKRRAPVLRNLKKASLP